jgi:hypothetical protein
VGVWLTTSTLLPVALAFLLPELPQARYLIFVLPFAALALGQLPALATIVPGAKRKGKSKAVVVWLGLAALVVAVQGVFGLPRTVRWIKSDYGRTIASVGTHARPGDGVLFYGPWQAIQFHYYRPEGFPPITLVPEHAPPQFTLEKDAPALQELLDTYQRLWVIPAAVDDVDPAHLGRGWLDAHAHPVWVTHNYSLYLPPSKFEAPTCHIESLPRSSYDLYWPPSEVEALSAPINLTFGEHLRLERVSSDAQAIAAGEGLRLTLYWTVSRALEHDVELKLALLDERDQRWLEWESIPGRWSDPPSTWQTGDFITVRQGLLVPQGAPPGPYTIELTVIDAASGAALQPSGAHVLTVDVIEPSWPPVLEDAGDFAGPFTFEPPPGAGEPLTLAGYDLGGLRFQQGYPVRLQLHWLAPARPTPAPEVELRLQLWHRSRPEWLGGKARPIATKTLALIPGYPLGDWQEGRVVSLLTALPIPADATPGRAELTLALIAPDGQPWTIDGQPRLNLSRMTVEQRPTLRRLPENLNPVQVDFEGLIGLRGYRLDGEARPGGQLELNYAWYALDRPPRQYAVFNHLLTADGQYITQVDGWPQDGLVLTKQWQPGEYVPDSYTLEIPADAPPGPYLLAVGLYDAATPEIRLSAAQNGQPLLNDQWLLAIESEP